MKECFKCHNFLPLTDFYKHSQMADGHVNKCKACNKMDVANNRSARLEYYQEYDRKRGNLEHRVKARQEYSKTDAGIEAHNRAKRKYTERNPERKRITSMVNNAVRDGKLIKPESCSECGSTGRIEGHHDDYNFPLDARWLCSKCHRHHHKFS